MSSEDRPHGILKKNSIAILLVTLATYCFYLSHVSFVFFIAIVPQRQLLQQANAYRWVLSRTRNYKVSTTPDQNLITTQKLD